ncbi:MAG: hypothetical protein H8E37_07210 [Planctomycetes bacterium]|nr:hypothetical protein [Planctomycetota bacterium]
MIELELELVRENPHWLTVLCAYQAAHEKLSRNLVDEPTADERAALVDSEMDGTEQESLVAQKSGAAKAPKIRKAIWLTRLTRVDGVGSDELSRTHGRLIAYGLLKCDLADRSAGVVYQLTSTGRQVIARLGSEVESSHGEAA